MPGVGDSWDRTLPAGQPPTVGREEELAAITWMLTGAELGGGRILVVEGEAGIGKTHLTERARELAAAVGMSVIAARGDEIDHDRPGHVLRALATGLGLDECSTGSGLALVDAVGDAMEDAAAHAGLLVVVDDLHWADELSTRGLATTARRITPLPVALMVTYRTATPDSMFDRAVASLPTPARRLRLGHLDGQHVIGMATSVLGSVPGPSLARRLAATGGNPFFVLELLSSLRDSGALQFAGGAADIAATAGPTLPRPLRQTVLARVAALPEATRETLRLASLLGREFTLADLATVAGTTVVGAAALLRSSLEAGVLAGETGSLVFRHDLLREAVYEDIPPAIRHDLHRAAARALAAADRPAEQVARQFALGARTPDAEAAAWSARAARSLVALDLSASVALFEQALALGGDRWAARAETEAMLLEPLAAIGRVDDARRLAAAALDRGVDQRSELAVLRGMAVVSAHSGDLGRAAAENDAAAAASTDPVEAALLDCLASSMGLLTGRLAGATRATAERGLALARDHTGRAADELACTAQQALALAAGVEGRYHDAVDHTTAARRLLVAGDFPSRGFVIPDVWEGTFLLYADRIDDAHAAFTRAHARAVQRGATSLLVQTHSVTGLAHFLAARWDDAAAELETALAVADETGNHSHVAGGHAVLARIRMARGDGRGAGEHLAAAHEAAAGVGHLVGIELLWWAQAAAMEASGDTAGALAVLAETWKQIGTLRGLVQYRTTGADLVRLACATGDLELARAVTEDIALLGIRAGTASASATALRCRGLVNDDPALLLQAVAVARGSPRRLPHAQTCEDAAQCLLGHGRPNEAEPLLDEAAAILAECGAVADIARIDALARRHGIRRRRQGPAPATLGWESLSPTEIRVVDLVAQGLSNPQVARQLFISRRTVETHLAHVFRKLGLANRTQLATASITRAASDR